MKLSLLAFLVAATMAFAAPAPASNDAKSQNESGDEYPLKTCVVSDEALGDGDIVTYTHREPGKPDRVIRLCCEGCIEDFKAQPAKFLQKLDAAEAAARKAGGAKQEKKSD